jgi:hypothetical protein
VKVEDRDECSRTTTLGAAAVACALIVLSLIAINVTRCPLSLEGSGKGLLTDGGFVLACGALATWVWQQRNTKPAAALGVGARTGLVLGVAVMTNHAIELFSPAQSPIARFIFGAGPVLLMMALLASAGSAGGADAFRGVIQRD